MRYDPFDAGTAYAYVGKRWVQCISEYYSSLKGKSERELMLATTEIRKRVQNHAGQFTVTAKKLATFLASVEAEESLLVQRLQDREAKNVLTIIENGSAIPGFPDSTFKQVGSIVQQEGPDPMTPACGATSGELTVYEEY